MADMVRKHNKKVQLSLSTALNSMEFHTHTQQHENLWFLYILLFEFLYRKLEDKRFCTE